MRTIVLILALLASLAVFSLTACNDSTTLTRPQPAHGSDELGES